MLSCRVHGTRCKPAYQFAIQHQTTQCVQWQTNKMSVSVMQAGVTCTNFSNYTAWKWQLEKKKKKKWARGLMHMHMLDARRAYHRTDPSGVGLKWP